MIANPHDPITLRSRLFRRETAAECIIRASVRDDRWRTALDDVNGDLERPRQRLDLHISAITIENALGRTSGSPPHSPVSATFEQYFLNSDSVINPSCSVAPALSSPVMLGKKGMKSSGWASL